MTPPRDSRSRRQYLTDLASLYDAHAENEEARLRYGAHAFDFQLVQHLLTAALRDFPTAEVIDLGAGPGTVGLWLAQAGLRVTMVDISTRSLAYARLRAQRSGLLELVHFIVADAAELPDRAYRPADILLCLGPLYHAHDIDHFNALIASWASALRPGGMFLANIANPYRLAANLLRDGVPSSTIQEIVDQVKHAGYVVYPDTSANPDLMPALYVTREMAERTVSTSGGHIDQIFGTLGILQEVPRNDLRDADHSELVELFMASMAIPEFVGMSEFHWMQGRLL